ncbi:MAG: hypothetical protein ACRD0S_08900 [Acidimicrobiales bacterium]
MKGVVLGRAGQAATDLDALVAAADEALYGAKAAGRNQVCTGLATGASAAAAAAL